MNKVELNEKEIKEAITYADEALHCLRIAKVNLEGAKKWGKVDMLGGGFISGMKKHSKMDKAKREMYAAKGALRKFSNEVKDVQCIDPVKIGDFLTFSDFFLDGFIFDFKVQSKIKKNLENCNEAIKKVEQLKAELEETLNPKKETTDTVEANTELNTKLTTEN